MKAFPMMQLAKEIDVDYTRLYCMFDLLLFCFYFSFCNVYICYILIHVQELLEQWFVENCRKDKLWKWMLSKKVFSLSDSSLPPCYSHLLSMSLLTSYFSSSGLESYPLRSCRRTY